MSVVELPLAGSASQAAVDAAGLQAELNRTTSGEVRFDRLTRALYSTDASIYQIVPLGLVVPRTEADIVATVKACARFRTPLTARGGGTSQAGQSIGAGVILDTSKHFNRILEINSAEGWARVEPGCVLDDLNLALKPHGFHFAPDVSTSNRATIGGMVANNSSGAHSVIYGKTVDHVLELRVVLADGSVIHCAPLDEAEWARKSRQSDLEGRCYAAVRRLAEENAAEIDRRYPKILRRVGGYNLDLFSRARGRSNLASFFVGAEGTLGVVVEAKVRLTPLPRAKALLVVQFADLLESLAATPPILGHGPAAVEVVDKYVLDSTKLNSEAARLRDFLRGDPGAVLFIEFYADSAKDLPARLEALEADLRRRGLGYDYQRAVAAGDQSRIWKLRKMSLGLSMAEKGDAKAISFVEDTAVAPERLRDYIAEFLQIIARHGTSAGVYAHASVGCLHVRPIINLKTVEGIERFESIAREVADLVLKYGGALSGEHGDGLVRSPFMEKIYGPTLYQAFREVKQTFDPLGILNPGKIVDAPPLATNLRFGARYVTPDVPTTFDFSADGGLARSAELCAGVGECRKLRDGAMCPSYQATCEEQHSTRGRANTIRLAITGQLGLESFTDPAVKEALDQCLECKACKSECPTNVDMARLKAEFLHQYFEKHGTPWRHRIFGNVARLSRWGMWFPALFNFFARSRLTRWWNDRFLGIAGRRVPPALARRDLLSRWEAEAAKVETGTPRGRVLLFPDTFTNYYEPEVGLAGARVLRRLGWQVEPGLLRGRRVVGVDSSNVLSGLECCGRPMISNGLLTQAVRNARTNVAALYPWAKAGHLIIACEPSCVLTIKDDYPALLRGEEQRQAEAVAAACRTFEEVVALALADGTPATRTGPGRILLQAHCHQRSLVGVGPSMRALRDLGGREVVDLDAGCCGLAGSFGYEKEHYELSRKVAEQRLLPGLRRMTQEDRVVAAGFSCRMQIAHLTGVQALHPAVLLDETISLLGEQFVG